MRIFSIFFGLALALLGLNQAFAGSESLTLLGAGPTGTVYMKAAPLGGYTGDDFYAGVLDWTDKGPNTPADIHTYCVDIASVIFVGQTYNLNSGSLSTLSFTGDSVNEISDIMNGIDHLWVNEYSLFQSTLNNTDPNGNDDAATLQMALWDIIYNPEYPLNSSTLNNASTPGSPLYLYGASNSADITNAVNYANAAYGNTTPFTPKQLSELSTLAAYEATDGSQNQIYMGLAVPLPSAFSSLLVLLGIVGLFGAVCKSCGWASQITRGV